ncbi:carboxypeptidase regulatory-like domain-containing protein [Namhaeicola litoreus]|uniref:Carboxypeptidase regulatory-like domain-containing protein n=1 Tax=Namhaeicola litoreus TaxID=1052145 RepID=A0ABW3XXC8_9FLAO
MIKIILLVMLCSINITFSQIKFDGVVKDSLGGPLELANVIAINEETSNLEAYSITDENGYFSMTLGENGKYKFQISYIGMKSTEEIVVIENSDITRNFILQADITLDEIELTYEMPVTIKGDTIVYNADSFKNGSERKLEDVLEKLPGVEINEDGQIEIEGKVVNKLMVNGKDFFDGDTKIATKNIPSNAVDKIQVLRNYSEVSQLSSVTNNSDSFALNIKLKEGKENFWFGNINAGGGYSAADKGLYLLQPKLFYYSPKFTFNFIGDMNNIGEVVLTPRDLRNFGGGFRVPSRGSGTDLNLGNNDLSFLTSQNNALAIENRLGATNFSWAVYSALDISGFAIFNSSLIDSKRRSITEFTDSDLGIPIEITDQTSKERSNQALLKLSASYKPNANNQLDYDILGRVSTDKQIQNLLSSVVGNTFQLDETSPYSINQNLNYYYTLNENNIFAFEAQHLLRDEDPFYNAIIENKENYQSTAASLGLDENQENYNIAQTRRIKSNQLDAKLDYYYIINAKSNLNLTLGTILSRQEFNSNLFQFLDDGSEFNPIPTFNGGLANNDVAYNFSDIYLGAHYRLKAGKITITPGFSIHSYANKNTQLGEVYEDNFFRIMPDFETRIQFKNSEILTFRYDMRNQFTDVTKLAHGLVLNNFSSIQFGEPELQNALSHNLSLIYSSFNLFNYTNVFARLAYSQNIDQIRNITFFENVINTSTFFNSSFADESTTMFGRVQRTFGKVIASINMNLNYSKINQFIDERRSQNTEFTQSYTPGVRTNFKKAPNVSLNYNYRIATNNQGTNETIFYTHAPYIDFDAYIWESVTFRTDYTYTRQTLKGGNSGTFQTWNASLAYRKNRDAKWEYEIVATNLLDIDSKLTNTATNLFVSQSQIFIQPRLITFRLRYEI